MTNRELAERGGTGLLLKDTARFYNDTDNDTFIVITGERDKHAMLPNAIAVGKLKQIRSYAEIQYS